MNYEEINNIINYLRLEDLLRVNNPGADFALLRSAFDFARQSHDGQTRDEGAPYFVHPCRVALFLAERFKQGDAELLAVALLHDVLEDCPGVTLQMLEEKFGSRVAEGVAALTKEKIPGMDKNRIRMEYARKIKSLPTEIKLIKLADRLDNIRSLQSTPKPGKVSRYINETRRDYLPLAWEVSPEIAAELERLMDGQQKS